jgi:hypothetical protein
MTACGSVKEDSRNAARASSARPLFERSSVVRFGLDEDNLCGDCRWRDAQDARDKSRDDACRPRDFVEHTRAAMIRQPSNFGSMTHSPRNSSRPRVAASMGRKGIPTPQS